MLAGVVQSWHEPQNATDVGMQQVRAVLLVADLNMALHCHVDTDWTAGADDKDTTYMCDWCIK